MDPNLFHLDYERTFELIVSISIIAIFIERALAVIFESRWFIEKTEGHPAQPEQIVIEDGKQKVIPAKKEKTKIRGIREIIAFVVSFGVCYFWDLDAISILLQTKEIVTVPGIFLTAGIVSGGAKGSNALFQNFLNVMSSAEKERKAK